MDNRRRVNRSRNTNSSSGSQNGSYGRSVQRRGNNREASQKKNILNFIALVLCCVLFLVTFINMLAPKKSEEAKPKKKDTDPNAISIQTARSIDDLNKMSYPEIDVAGFTTIPGFVPLYVKNQDSEEYSLVSFDTSMNNFTVDAVGYYNGPFFENGSDIVVENAFAAVVTNSSSSIISNGKLILKAGDRQINFTISYLPERSTAVIVNDENTTFQKDAQVSFVSFTGSTATSQDIKDVLDVQTSDGSISVKNITQDSVSDINIYYKNKVKGIYYGGIAYRSYLSYLDPDQQSNLIAQHFSDGLAEIVYYSYTLPVDNSILDGSTVSSAVDGGTDNENNNG